MIKLNYLLVRDEGNEEVTYIPKDYPTEFNNLIFLKGPNGSGKSAILHIIALALYGNTLSDAEIDPGLKRKIENLLDLNHNKLTFELEISNPETGLTLISRKDNPTTKDIRVSVKRDGKETSYPRERFNREFKLVYTIPNNPTTQLPQLLSEIQVSQSDIGGKVSDFRRYLEDKIQKIRSSRDEQTLETARRDLNDTKWKKEIFEDNLYKANKEYNKLLLYHVVKNYLESRSRKNAILNNITSIDNAIKDLSKTSARNIRVQKSAAKEYENTINTIEREKQRIEGLLTKYKIDDYKVKLSTITNSSVIQEIKNPNVQRTIREYLPDFTKLIESLIQGEKIAHDKELKSFELYESLLEVLDNSRYLFLQIPGTDGNVNALIVHIKEAMEEVRSIQGRINGYMKEIKWINEFLDDLNSAIEYRKNFPISMDLDSTDNEIELQSLQHKLTYFQREVTQCDLKTEHYRQLIISLKEDPVNAIPLETTLNADEYIKQFIDYSDANLVSKLNEMKNTYDSNRHQLEQVKELLTSKERTIANLENEKIDPDRIFLSRLDKLRGQLISLEHKFKRQFPSSLDRIKNRKINELTGEDESYSEQIGSYYAKKMKTVIYGSQEHKVISVSILDEVITTEAGKKIKFDDLSTGQSQSSYLTTKLGMMGTKTTIALFDEVAMMDNNSLIPVVAVIKANFVDKKLLGAIIVQKAELPEVKDL